MFLVRRSKSIREVADPTRPFNSSFYRKGLDRTLTRYMPNAAEIIAEGRQARNRGDLASARSRYSEAASVYYDQNDLLAYAHTIRHIADIYQEEAKLREAKPLYEEAIELSTLI